MSRTKVGVVGFAWGLLGVLAIASVYAGEKAPPPKVIASIEFKGAEHFSAKELQQYTNLAVGMAFDAGKASEDCAAIVRHYQEHGYPFATCSQSLQMLTPVRDGNLYFISQIELDKLTYTINEGPKVKVHHVEFIGNTFVGAGVLAEQLQSHKRGSSRTNFAAVQEDVIRLTEYYRSFGYLDVVVSYELQWNLDGGEATMMFHLNEGERYKVK